MASLLVSLVPIVSAQTKAPASTKQDTVEEQRSLPATKRLASATLTSVSTNSTAEPDPDSIAIDAIKAAASQKLEAWANSKDPLEVRDRARDIILAQETDDLESFAADHPDSPWTPSIRVNVGRRHRLSGRVSKSLDQWEKAWMATKHITEGPGKAVADDALVHWTRLLASLGRFDTLSEVFNETKDRRLDGGPMSQVFVMTKEAHVVMRRNPEFTYKCGVYALNNVAHALRGTNHNGTLLLEEGSTDHGLTLEALAKLSEKYKLDLVPAHRTGGGDLVVPSVVHWKQNHYAAIVGQQGDLYEVIDPTFDDHKMVSADVINEEASGWFMVPAGASPKSWSRYDQTELQSVYGRGFPYILDNSGDGPPCPNCPCPPGNNPSKGPPKPPGNNPPNPGNPNSSNGPTGGGGPAGGGGLAHANCANCGMASWRVSEPYLNLWLHDTPFFYEPAIGPAVQFEVSYRQRNDESEAHLFFPSSQWQGVASVGTGWNCSWLSWVATPEGKEYLPSQVNTYYVFLPGGGRSKFVFQPFNSFAMSYENNLQLELVATAGEITRFVLHYSDGRTLVYGLVRKFATGGGPPDQWMLTEQRDTQGKGLVFGYEYGPGQTSYNPSTRIARLKTVTDADNHVVTLTYATNPSPYLGDPDPDHANRITRITDAWGRYAELYYVLVTPGSDLYNLNHIVDMESIPSHITYGASVGWPSALDTPYGTTSFTYYSGWDLINGEANIDRGIRVTEPGGVSSLYIYRDYVPDLPAIYSSGLVPVVSGNTFDNNYANRRLSFYWNPSQTPLIFDNAGAISLGLNHYKNARMRHWLGEYGHGSVVGTLALERDASADLLTEGQLTWYDYAGKQVQIGTDGVTPYSAAPNRGTQVMPSIIARRLPDGSTWSESYVRDSYGRPTTVTSTYGDGSSTRSYGYTYSASDLTDITGPNGPIAHYTYYSDHQLNTETLYPDATHSYSISREYFPTTGLLKYVTYPNGTRLEHVYNPQNLLQARHWRVVSTGATLRSESFTYYANGLLLTHTDARNLARTFTWDNLQRVTRIDYSTGGFESFDYTVAQAMNPGYGLKLLDLTKWTARQGSDVNDSTVTRYDYNGRRQLIRVTDPKLNETEYGYCSCGALESIEDGEHHTTSWGIDYAGRTKSKTFPGSPFTTQTYVRNLLGQVSDLKNNAGLIVATYSYDNLGFLKNVSNPSPGGQVASLKHDKEDNLTEVNVNGGAKIQAEYDRLGRLTKRTMVHPTVSNQSIVEIFEYDFNGLKKYTDGLAKETGFTYDLPNLKITRTDPVNHNTVFTFNGAGDLVELSDGRSQKTQWEYDAEGRLRFKRDASGGGGAMAVSAEYTYYQNGLPKDRILPGNVKTTYTYDAAGNLKKVDYPNDPDVDYVYDGANRLHTVTDTVLGSITIDYEDFGSVKRETQPSNWASGVYEIGFAPTADRQRQSWTITKGAANQGQTTYDYDAVLRLKTTTSAAGTFTYNYLSGNGGNMLDFLSLPGGSLIDYGYDEFGRLNDTQLKNSASVALNLHHYDLDKAHRKSKQTRLGSHVDYLYFDDGQLQKASGFEDSPSVARRHENFDYTYDAAGNLATRVRNGALTETFSTPGLNQLGLNSGVTFAGQTTVSGMTTGGAASVTVNGQAATLYPSDGSYASPSMTPASSYTVTAVKGGQTFANDPVPASPTSPLGFTYDAFGNLHTYGGLTYDYDNENRLRLVTYNGGSVQYLYDGLSRLRVRTESGPSGTTVTRYLYDGMQVVQERDGNNNVLVTYTRGRDLSGTLSGAGGIGGLLARSQATGATTRHDFYHSDAGGNVTMMISSAQKVVARYLYDSFGNTLGQAGPLAAANSYRFSGKQFDDTTGLYSYGYRFYEPSLQRWLNRDPIGERGGINLYGFVANNPLSYVDRNGLDLWIIKDTEGRYGHETVIGSNPDGTFWDAGKFPGSGLLSPLLCSPDIRFRNKSPFNPQNLPKGTKIADHIPTSPESDAKAKEAAKDMAQRGPGLYMPGVSDCTHFASCILEPFQPPSPPRIPPLFPSKPVIISPPR